jgi:hypothetical protein
VQRPEVIINMTTAILLERLDPAILDGIDYLRRPNKPTLAERYYDKRSNSLWSRRSHLLKVCRI